MALYNLQDCKEYAEYNGGKCLSTEYISHQRLTWECAEGHTWEQYLSYILRGNWCGKCKYKTKKLNALQKCKEFAEKYGGKCLSDKYVNEQTQLLWQCAAGHTWYLTPRSIFSQKFNCVKCNVSNHKYTLLEKCIAYAKEKGGKCLSTDYTNLRTIMKWECGSGHIFYRTYLLIEKGAWCYECEKSNNLTLAECQDIAFINYGGICLSKQYRENMIWECKYNHLWRDTAENVCRKRKWCSECEAKESNATDPTDASINAI